MSYRTATVRESVPECVRHWGSLRALLCGLRVPSGQLRADGFHLFTRSGGTFAAVGCGVDQLFQIDGKLRSKSGSDFADQRLNLRKNADVLAVCVSEKIQADGPPIDQSRRHVPISNHHAHMTAMLAEDRGPKIRPWFLD